MVFKETPRMSRMTSNPFWLNDEAWSLIEPMLPKNQPGARRVDDRRVLSGIFHVLRSGCRWRGCPPEYGPRTTIYNRFNRWSRRKIVTVRPDPPFRPPSRSAEMG